MANDPDVIALLTDQHRRIKEMFTAVNRAQLTSTKQEHFDELRAFLAVHETAEELVTHPRARLGDGGNAVVDARLEEEHQAKKMLAELDKMKVDDRGFDTAFAEFQKAVLDHAEKEEQEEFPVLRRDTDKAMLERMATAVKAAEAIAPTHPHPAAGEAMVTNLAAGPMASLVDRTRDAVKAVLDR